MNQIELLWQLQKHDDELKTAKESLEELAKKGYIENITIRIKNLEHKLDEKKKFIEENDRRLKESNLTLRELNYQLEGIEKSLYDGSVKDLKQLDFMDKESKKIRHSVNNMELEMLSLMEEIDISRTDIDKLQTENDKLKKDFERYIIEHKKVTDELRQKVRKEMEIIYDLSSKLEKELYARYNEIKKNKGYAIVEVIKDECSGCHMILPIYILNKAKNNEEIVECENCGRILYYKEKE